MAETQTAFVRAREKHEIRGLRCEVGTIISVPAEEVEALMRANPGRYELWYPPDHVTLRIDDGGHFV